VLAPTGTSTLGDTMVSMVLDAATHPSDQGEPDDRSGPTTTTGSVVSERPPTSDPDAGSDDVGMTARLWATFGTDCELLRDGQEPAAGFSDFSDLLASLGVDVLDPVVWWQHGTWLVVPFDDQGVPIPLAGSPTQWWELLSPPENVENGEVLESEHPVLIEARRHVSTGNRFCAFAQYRLLMVPKVQVVDSDRRHRQAVTVTSRLRSWAHKYRTPGIVAVPVEVFDGSMGPSEITIKLWHPDLVPVGAALGD
jgi:hypothetical protein